jgi:hypothetical protein
MITESEHLSQIAAHYLGENTALRGKVVELEAEVGRLKAEDELIKWKLKVQVVAREDERFGPWSYVNVKVDDIGYADKVAVLSPVEPLVKMSELHEVQAEVERLKGKVVRLQNILDMEDAEIMGVIGVHDRG